MADTTDERVVYINGGFVPESQASISILDRGFTAGDSAFDTMRTFKGEIFKLNEHLVRLYRSCKYIGIDPGMTKEEMASLTLEVLERNKHLLGPDDDYWVTQRVTRGLQGSSIRAGQEGANVIILCQPLPWENRAKYFKVGVPLRTSPIRRTPPEYLDPRAKVQNYINQTLADELARDGHPDALSLLLDMNGNVAEGSGYNFFIVSDGKVMTSEPAYVLGGISRDTVNEICQELSIPLAETAYNLFDVYNADEAFITGSSYCMLPVSSVDGRTIGEGTVPGAVTGRILRTWSGMVGVDIAQQYLAHVEDA